MAGKLNDVYVSPSLSERFQDGFQQQVCVPLLAGMPFMATTLMFSPVLVAQRTVGWDMDPTRY